MDYDHVKKQLGYGIQTESKDNAIKAIEQLTARVRELEEEQRIAELIAELEHIREQKNRLWFEFSIATQQLATLKAELREICAAIDDPACDLTLTAVECIKKLKGENEWQPIETAPKDCTEILAVTDVGQMVVFFEGGYWREKANFMGLKREPTHWMPLPKPPAISAANGKSNV